MARFADDSGPNESTRVMIVDVSEKLAQLIEDAVRQQPDMTYLGKINADVRSQEGNLRLLQFAWHNVDVLILHAPKVYPLPGVFTHLLDQYRDLKLLVISEPDEAMCVYWMGLRRKEMSRVSIGSLLDNIRYLANLNPLQ